MCRVFSTTTNICRSTTQFIVIPSSPELVRKLIIADCEAKSSLKCSSLVPLLSVVTRHTANPPLLIHAS